MPLMRLDKLLGDMGIASRSELRLMINRGRVTVDGRAVTAPETIAGITAHVKDSTADVSFDNTQLGLGSLANGRLAPLAAPYVLGQSWAGAYIDSTGTEDGLLRATYRLGYDKQELVVDTWFTE